MEKQGGVLQFDLSTKQMRYRDILNKEFIELEVYAISDINPNRNDSHFTLESMEKAKPNVKNKPIVGFFEEGDFTTHEGKADYDIETQKEFWNTERGERILGWVRESDPVEIVEEGGLHWLKFRCILCTNYGYKQVLRLLKDKKKKVSVEVVVHDSEKINGIEHIKDFTLNGVTILGSKHGKAVLEGIPGAHLSVLENMDDEMFEEQKKMLAFAYQQFDGANDGHNVVEDEKCLGEENTKKEVNQANMEVVKVETEEAFAFTIKVDKSKEAMSDKPWGEVDKAELRRKVVEATNFKSVADDIFLDLREGWEDGEVSKLKYPVMELNGDTAVYNRGALASAKAYAEQHDEGAVLNKLKEIYEHLELDEETEEEKQVAYVACKECKEEYCDECGCNDDNDDNDENGEPQEECGHLASEETAPLEVVKVAPDVTIVTEPTGVVNEEQPELNMEQTLVEMDLGIPQCNNDPDGEKAGMIVDERMPAELVPEEGMGVIIANDKEVVNVQIVGDQRDKTEKANDVADHSQWIEQLEALKMECDNWKQAACEKDEIIAQYKADLEKCCDYEELKTKLCTAEDKLEQYRRKELVAVAHALMDCENIKEEFYDDILRGCEKGEYACEDDIKKDVALAIYNSRQSKEHRYSAGLPVVEIINRDSQPKVQKNNLSAAEGIQNYIKKK